MGLTHCKPLLRTLDVDQSVAFYTQLLGFTCVEHRPEWGWACLRQNEIELMLALPNAHDPIAQTAFTGSLYFSTDAIEPLWERLQGHASVCYPLETFDWGMREFAIYDPNGYLLQFGQEIE